MKRKSSNRYWMLGCAREYARSNKWEKTVIWIERAAAVRPLTEMQLWAIRKITGPYKYDELGLSRFENIGREDA